MADPIAASALLSRKIAPRVDQATFDDLCLGTWSLAHLDEDRKSDTWIGITDLRDYKFYMFPAFGFEPQLRAKRSSAKLSKPTEANSPVITRTIVREVAGKMQHLDREAIQRFYGDAALIVQMEQRPASPPTFDGILHREAIQLINRRSTSATPLTEKEALGWSIRPQGSGIAYLIRYSSGRNDGKFVPRPPPRNKGDLDYLTAKLIQAEGEPDPIAPLDPDNNRIAARDARETRDLPKAWASWVRQVIMKYLALVFEEDLSSSVIAVFGKDPLQPSRIPSRADAGQPKWARAEMLFRARGDGRDDELSFSLWCSLHSGHPRAGPMTRAIGPRGGRY